MKGFQHFAHFKLGQRTRPNVVQTQHVRREICPRSWFAELWRGWEGLGTHSYGVGPGGALCSRVKLSTALTSANINYPGLVSQQNCLA